MSWVRKSEGLTFVKWLSAIVRCPEWNGTVRTPAAWQNIYDADVAYIDAAKKD